MSGITKAKNDAQLNDDTITPVHLYRTPTSPGALDSHAPMNSYIRDDEDINKSDLEIVEGTSSGKTLDDLLRQIVHQSDDYRFITFRIPDDLDSIKYTGDNYDKRVAFDTINIDIAKDKFAFDDDDEYTLPLESKKYGNDLNLNFIDTNRGRESMRSPSPMSRSPLHSPMRNSSLSRFYVAPRADYPTKPIITHRGCTFTKTHKSFEDLYAKKLYNKDHGYLKPILPRRTILVYISGRKHTWVALDWILNKFIEQGDTIVIVSAIRHELKARRRSGHYTQLHQGIDSKDYRTRMRYRNRPENIKHIARNIMNYALEVINANIIAKISIEIAMGTSREVLKDMYKLYEPNLVCTGTKPNSKRSAPLKSWTSSKLSDRLVKNFPLPVIVVPAMKMNDFEEDLALGINQRYSQYQPLSRRSTLSNSRNSEFSLPANDSTPETGNNTDSADDNSDTSSINSNLSVDSESYSSYNEIKKLYKEYKQMLSKNLKQSQAKPYNEDYFANCLRVISDESTYLCQEIRNINPGYQGKGSTLAKAITGSNSFGVIPFKAKSLLLPENDEDNKVNQSNQPPSLSYKEMKRNLRKNMQKNQDTSVPQINVSGSKDQNILHEPPKASALRFVDLETPSKDRNANRSHKLGKSLSHDIDSSTQRPKLEQSRSHPDLTTIPREDSSKSSKKKKKRKRFLGLF